AAHLAHAPRNDVAYGTLRGDEDRVRDDFWRVHGRDRLWLRAQKRLRLLEQRRVDAARLHEREPDRNPLLFQLHAQRVRECLDGVFRRAIVPLEGNRAVGERARDIDDGAAAVTQMLDGREHAVHLTPVVDVELPAHVFQRHLGALAIDRYRGVVDPGIDSAELRDCARRERLDLRRVGDIAHLIDGTSAVGANRLDRLPQIPLVARGEDDAHVTLCGFLRGDQPDAARRTGDDHDL